MSMTERLRNIGMTNHDTPDLADLVERPRTYTYGFCRNPWCRLANGSPVTRGSGCGSCPGCSYALFFKTTTKKCEDKDLGETRYEAEAQAWRLALRMEQKGEG